MAVTTKKTFNAVGSGGQSSTTVFTPVSIELNNQDDLDVYVTKASAGISANNNLRIKHYRQSTTSNLDANHEQVNDTTGLYFPALTHTGGTETLENYTISTDNDTITFNAALPAGAVVSIERRTRDSSSNYTNFVGGSTIRHTDVNKAFDESNFTAQEGRNKAFELEGKIFGGEATSTSFITSDEIVDGTIVDADINASAQIAVNKLADGSARQVLQTASNGSDVEWTDNVDVPGTLDVTGAADFDSTVKVDGTLNVVSAVDFDNNLNVDGTLTVDGVSTLTGNVTVGGTVDGRDVAADGTKLDGIESGATADQSNAEIRAAVEAASDSNVFTDADHSKLNAIEASATADQTAAEIRTLVESASDSNVFTDADHSKLNAIEASADVTDATNVDAAGAVMNSDLATKGTIIVGDGSGDPTILPVGTNNHVLVADSNEASGVKWSTVSSASGFNNVVEDTTPQLGGALDVQAQEINTSTTNGNIKLTPNGTGVVEVKGNTNPGTLQLNCENNSHSVKIKGPAHSAAASYTLTLPDDDGTVDQVLKTDGSGNLSWGANVVIWTLGINGGADAFTFTGPGFASATDDPQLYLSRGQTYKFINGNSSGTHAFNIEKSDHDATWSAYTTGMTGAGATGGNTMTWTVPMDAPSLLRYVSGTTAAMSNRIHITDSSVTEEGFECNTGARVSGLQVNNSLNGSHMAFFGTHPTGYQPNILGRAGATTTFQAADGYDFDKGNINLQSYGTNETTPATIKFEGGGSSNTYGVTISGPATAQATSNYTITLPGVVPTSNGQVLSATTAGVCSWADSTPLTTEGDILYRDGSGTQRLAKGTAGQALIMNSGATAPEWGAAGATIANDANNRVITADGSAGLNGEANLTFDGSTLALTGNQTATLAVQAQGYEAPATVTANWSIAAANNAFFPGPMTVDSGVTVTVPANRTLTIV